MARTPAGATATLTAILIADGEDFVSRPIPAVELVYGGMAGDLHAGLIRPACSRVPWHPRATEIANTRQLSLVCEEECAEVATELGVAAVPPALLGANLVVQGIPAFSALPPATRLQFPSGATIFITEENGPCVQPGAKLAKAFGREGLTFAFVRAAAHRRGLLGLVERQGPIAAEDVFRVILSPTRRV
jgi:hypothetical protein